MAPAIVIALARGQCRLAKDAASNPRNI